MDPKASSQVNDGAHKIGISQQEMLDYYSEWAVSGKYDQDLGPQNYKGPVICAEELDKQIRLKDSKILDVAAGTGFLGKQLTKRGFTNIDAMEPSQGMVKILNTLQVYQQIFCEAVDDKEVKSVKPNVYDAIGIAGGMGEGHIPCIGLLQLITIVKRDGIVTIVMRKAYLEKVVEYKNRLEPFMAYLEKKGYWKMLKREVKENYSFTNDGLVFTFKVLTNDEVDYVDAEKKLNEFC